MVGKVVAAFPLDDCQVDRPLVVGLAAFPDFAAPAEASTATGAVA